MLETRIWRVWHTISTADTYMEFFIPVVTVEHAALVIETLTQQQRDNESIRSNTFGLEWFDGYEWKEYDNDGMEIDALMRHGEIEFNSNVEVYLID